MSRKATNEYIGTKRRAYAQADRAKRTRILDEVCETTGCERKYANRLLTGNRKFRERKGRGKTYGDDVAEVLKRVWREAGCPCLPYFKAEVERSRLFGPRLAAESRLSIPSFDDAFFVPWNAPKEEPEDAHGMPSQDQLNAALPDAWVLFHGVMKDLKAGRISRERAAERARAFAHKADCDEIDIYDEIPGGYCQNGESTALAFRHDLPRGDLERFPFGLKVGHGAIKPLHRLVAGGIV